MSWRRQTVTVTVTGQKTQLTVSKHWRRCYKRERKERKQLNTVHICTENNIHTQGYTQNKHSKSPSLHWYGVTRGQLPQRAGSLGLNGGGAAAVVPPHNISKCSAISQPKLHSTTLNSELLTSVTYNHHQQHSTTCQEKNGPLNMSKITLWIDNYSHYFSIFFFDHEKPSICNVYVKFHDN